MLLLLAATAAAAANGNDSLIKIHWRLIFISSVYVMPVLLFHFRSAAAASKFNSHFTTMWPLPFCL